MGFAPTWLRQVSPLLHMTTHFNHWLYPRDVALSVLTKVIIITRTAFLELIRPSRNRISETKSKFCYPAMFVVFDGTSFRIASE